MKPTARKGTCELLSSRLHGFPLLIKSILPRYQYRLEVYFIYLFFLFTPFSTDSREGKGTWEPNIKTLRSPLSTKFPMGWC